MLRVNFYAVEWQLQEAAKVKDSPFKTELNKWGRIASCTKKPGEGDPTHTCLLVVSLEGSLAGFVRLNHATELRNPTRWSSDGNKSMFPEQKPFLKLEDLSSAQGERGRGVENLLLSTLIDRLDERAEMSPKGEVYGGAVGVLVHIPKVVERVRNHADQAVVQDYSYYNTLLTQDTMNEQVRFRTFARHRCETKTVPDSTLTHSQLLRRRG